MVSHYKILSWPGLTWPSTGLRIHRPMYSATVHSLCVQWLPNRVAGRIMSGQDAPVLKRAKCDRHDPAASLHHRARDVPSSAPLHVVGNQLENPAGDTVVLRGVNISSLEWRTDGDKLTDEDRKAIVEIARPLGRAVSPNMSDFFLEAHKAFGATFRLGVGVNAIRGVESAGTLQTLRTRKLIARTAQRGRDDRHVDARGVPVARDANRGRAGVGEMQSPLDGRQPVAPCARARVAAALSAASQRLGEDA